MVAVFQRVIERQRYAGGADVCNCQCFVNAIELMKDLQTQRFVCLGSATYAGRTDDFLFSCSKKQTRILRRIPRRDNSLTLLFRFTPSIFIEVTDIMNMKIILAALALSLSLAACAKKEAAVETAQEAATAGMEVADEAAATAVDAAETAGEAAEQAGEAAADAASDAAEAGEAAAEAANPQ